MSETTSQTVLVVEDDLSVQALIRKVLTAEGFAVEVANDGVDALSKIGESKPHLVISDVMMPQLDGVAFTKALKSHPLTKDVPVVLVTAKSDTPSVVEGMRAGAFFYLSKPFKRDDLLATVRQALKSRKK